MSAKEYYSLPVENRQTYPVYYPGREPEGCWEMLQHVPLKPLIEPEKLKSEAKWIEAGRKVFNEADDLHLRTSDPKIIAAARARETFEQVHAQPLRDGTCTGCAGYRRSRGVALSLPNCSGCHLLYLTDDTPVPGAPSLAGVARGRDSRHRVPRVGPIHAANRVVTGATPFLMGPEPLGAWLYQAYQAYGVPWKRDDINERLKTVTRSEYESAHRRRQRWRRAYSVEMGVFFVRPRLPDLIGIKDRKYMDHSATHLHRGIGDLMRYAALVSFADTADFGAHHMLSPETKRVPARLPDEALYALALYSYSLQPPPNPNVLDEKATAGQKFFAREGCPGCHTPPLYTSNKLTLAQGLVPPKNAPGTLDIQPLSVGTDPGLALGTRKGTGYCKVPSLKGVWYWGHYLHDGSVASLEEMFDPDRLREQHEPGGWSPPDTKTRAIKGHEFGSKLKPEEREQVIAFLRTL
jgi:hypothetical protein